MAETVTALRAPPRPPEDGDWITRRGDDRSVRGPYVEQIPLSPRRTNYDRLLTRGISVPPVMSLRGAPVVDIVCGVALTAFGLLLAATVDNVGGLLQVLTIPTVTLPVLWRRRAPLAATVALSVGVVVSAVPTFDQWRCGVAIPAALLIAYALGRRADRRAARRGLPPLLAAMGVLVFTDPVVTPDTIVLLLPLCLYMWGTGRFVAARGRVAEELGDRSLALEHQRTQTAKLAVEIERTRLTSELDGAVRANIDDIVRLAQRGESELATDPAASRRAFARIEAAGRNSLDEMRELLGALRSDEHAVREPRPTLAQLDRLLADARAGGRVVDLDIAGERGAVSDGVELAAYRIVEHALAAVGADGEGKVNVRLRFAPDALEVEVEGGRQDRGAAGEGSIVAAREQTTARGGSFVVRTAGPGRTLMCARLPLVAGHA